MESSLRDHGFFNCILFGAEPSGYGLHIFRSCSGGLITTCKGYSVEVTVLGTDARVQPLQRDHLGLCDKQGWQNWLFTRPGGCLVLLSGWSQGCRQEGERQLPMWWSSLFHFNMSPSKVRSPTLEFNSFGLFPPG